MQDLSLWRLLAVGLAAGMLFAIGDALLNANPLAQHLYAIYRPLSRQSVNAPLGLVFDLISGVVMALLFAELRPVLPGGVFAKGAAFGVMAWFFRAAMGAASQVVMLRIPLATVAYGLAAGLLEMVALGWWYGAWLRAE